MEQNETVIMFPGSSKRSAGLRANAGMAREENARDVGRPMRVVHVIKHCGYANGSVHVAVDLACVQARAGYDVTVVSEGGTFVPLLEEYGVRHIAYRHRKPLELAAAAWQLTRLARRLRPDIIHAHMMGSAIIGYVAARFSGAALVTTVHNSFDRHSFFMGLGDRVVAVSEAERAHLLEKGYSEKKVVAVLNAPDASPRETFMKNGQDFVLESPCILAANALHRRKGVFDLIRACSILFPEFPDWKLYVAGEGPDGEELKQQAQEVGFGDRIRFLGFVPNPRPLMEQADIFVLASYADPCSLAIGEARSAGCAIVATEVGGTSEMLEFGRAGRLVQPGDPEQLARELRSLMADEAARLELRRASREGSSIFRVDRLVGDYERAYREAQGTGRSKQVARSQRHVA